MAKRRLDPILKHLITYICPRKCSYCINQYMHPKIVKSYKDVEEAYKDLRDWNDYKQGYQHAYGHIAITGGEPTEEKSFKETAVLARKYFRKVSLWTQNKNVVSWIWLENYFDDIVLGVHVRTDSIISAAEFYKAESCFEVKIDIPVYIGILADNYKAPAGEFEQHLLARGYSGLTIREKYPNGKPLKSLISNYENFPVRLVKKEDYYGDYALLPNNNYVECTG